MTDQERLAILEYKTSEQAKELESINRKLDELLELRSKGLGAFWLASGLLGTGIIGALFTLAQWMKTW